MKAMTGLAVVVVVCAAVVCRVADAVGPGGVALMALPREALGGLAVGMALLSDSGVDSNAEAARDAGGGVTGAGLARGGRVTGYTLDYALPAAGPPGLLGGAGRLLGVQTIAELYRDGSAARNGLVFWRRVTSALNVGAASGITVGVSSFVARVGDGAFGFELVYRRAGRPLFYVGDVVFRTGVLLGAVFVSAGGEAGLRARTVGLADRLAVRIDRVVAGKPVSRAGRG
jgi:hypothetical protein